MPGRIELGNWTSNDKVGHYRVDGLVFVGIVIFTPIITTAMRPYSQYPIVANQPYYRLSLYVSAEVLLIGVVIVVGICRGWIERFGDWRFINAVRPQYWSIILLVSMRL